MPVIRIVKLSDARDLAELAESTFRHTFASHNTVENMDIHCKSSYGVNIQTREIRNPEYETLVAEDQHRLIAYAQLRWGRPPDCVPGSSPGEIHRFYVDSVWQGKGLAKELMCACLDIMTGRGRDVVWLGVWEDNPRAISFYRKFEFQAVGEHVFPVGHDPQTDIIMVRSINIPDTDNQQDY